MAANPQISNAAAIAALNVIVDLLDVGSPNGQLLIYDATGGIPADVDEAITTQVLLATLELSATAFGAAADDTPGAIATADTITAETNATAGVAAFFRAVDANGLAVIQGTCGTTDADLIMNTVNIASGATVACSSWTVSLPEG